MVESRPPEVVRTPDGIPPQTGHDCAAYQEGGSMFSLSDEQSDRAQRLHRESIVIDTLGPAGPSAWNDKVLSRIDELASEALPPNVVISEVSKLTRDALFSGELNDYWDGWDASGVDVSSVTMGPFGTRPFTYENGVRDLATWTQTFDKFDQLVKVTKGSDIERIHDEGKHGLILNFQNTTHFGDDLEALQFFYKLGIRIIQLTYNSRNFIGDGCTERNPAGLSLFGIEAVKRMNDLGILIDVSHCSEPTSLEAVEYSEVPIAITHSVAKSVHHHDRGKSDKVISAVGERGYVGVAVVPFFLTSDPQATLEHWLAHFNHIVKLVGPEHVGIGTDWGAEYPKVLNDLLNEEIKRFGFREEHKVDWAAVTEGFATWREWPNLTGALVHAGYSDEEIKGFVGGNFLRLFKEAVG
jgi:membrane dipeptidase